MTRKSRSNLSIVDALVRALVIACAAAGGASAASVVGGVTPSVRPDAAPVIDVYAKSDAWLDWARRGVTAPFPPSLGFLADQGGWYTPFTHRGMTGRYDIRGLQAMPDALPARKAAK